MGRYVIKRLLMLVPVVLGVTFLTFAIAKAVPGDPVDMMLQGSAASPEIREQIRQALGLNDPLLVQYGRFVGKAIQGDLGLTIRGSLPVAGEIAARIPSTLELTVAAMAVAILLGMTVGIIAGTGRGTWRDRGAMVFALIGLSVPGFWLGIMCIIFFGVQLRWISIVGGEGLKDLILPAIALGLGPAAVLARLTRSSVLEVMGDDYVRTARAKGLAERVTVLSHVLPNALIPVVTVMGLQFAGMLGGAVIIEAVFGRPGLGRLAVEAIGARDYPVVQGVTLVASTVYVLVNLAVDLLYALIDPRIRYS